MAKLTIAVKGLPETIEGLRRIDSSLARELKKDIKQAAEPILRDAKGYARALGGTGTYASSLAMRAVKTGVRIQSGDPGAGTKEFAKRGAFYLSGVRAGRPIGVPKGGPPRALVKSSLQHEDQVRADVETRMEQVISRYLNG